MSLMDAPMWHWQETRHVEIPLPRVFPLSGLGVVVHEVGLALRRLGHLPPLRQGSQVHAGVKRTLFGDKWRPSVG